MTAMNYLQGAIGTGLAVLNVVYWWYVTQRALPRFRRACERRYGVEITTGTGGNWHVEGGRSAVGRIAIGWLQVAFFLAAVVVWALAAGLGGGAIFLLR